MARRGPLPARAPAQAAARLLPGERPGAGAVRSGQRRPDDGSPGLSAGERRNAAGGTRNILDEKPYHLEPDRPSLTAGSPSRCPAAGRLPPPTPATRRTPGTAPRRAGPAPLRPP